MGRDAAGNGFLFSSFFCAFLSSLEHDLYSHLDNTILERLIGKEIHEGFRDADRVGWREGADQCKEITNRKRTGMKTTSAKGNLEFTTWPPVWSEAARHGIDPLNLATVSTPLPDEHAVQSLQYAPDGE
jgi:hypothetical protein